MICNLIQR